MKRFLCQLIDNYRFHGEDDPGFDVRRAILYTGVAVVSRQATASPRVATFRESDEQSQGTHVAEEKENPKTEPKPKVKPPRADPTIVRTHGDPQKISARK